MLITCQIKPLWLLSVPKIEDGRASGWSLTTQEPCMNRTMLGSTAKRGFPEPCVMESDTFTNTHAVCGN